MSNRNESCRSDQPNPTPAHIGSEGARLQQTQGWITQLHLRFRKKAKQQTVYVRLTQLLIFCLFISWWELAGRLGWIDVLLFSYPGKIASHLANALMDGSLPPHIGVTVMETVSGFLLGTLLGTSIAALLWWYPFVSRVLDPYLVVLNSMPKVALGPIFIVGLGPGFMSIVATTLSITVIITTLVIYNRFREVDGNYVKVVRLFGATRSQIFLNVILPASFPVIISTLKVNVGLAWVGVIVGEFLVAKAGLGYLIIYGFQVFNFTLVLSSLVVIAIVAAIMYQLVAMLEEWLTSGWKER
ncbi:ABC transporter permease [Paenibacillus abyssi]|uniref:ABC transporter permease protein YtlD n=1 Tax=Paenibacillus abyssi TaxID=1340531 RepID=A0A917CI09_9BACL|nr:ABC transporter permease [Paenibacillus abyssi]GGF89612.1 putative ABC transporter permease protein YtlD [Paenibacillus abyssi]